MAGSLLDGKARFDAHIIDVISSSTGLDASDPVCKRNVVAYPAAGTEPNRGLEAFQLNDRYQIIDSGFGIEMQMDVPSFSDQLRVITRCGANDSPALQD